MSRIAVSCEHLDPGPRQKSGLRHATHVPTRSAGGGRHREFLSPDKEKAFLALWLEQVKNGGVIVVPPIHVVYEERGGKKLPSSTVYRMLARHGWRKVTPDIQHPKSQPKLWGVKARRG